MGVETGRACNLRCRYCFAGSGTPLAGELTTPELLAAIDQAVALGARVIPIVGGGEPTLNPDLTAIVGHIAARGALPGVFTNGIRVTAALARRLFEQNAYVVAKLNSFDDAVEDDLVGRAGASRAIKRGLRRLQDAGFNRTQPSRLAVHTIIVRQNLAEIPTLFRWMRQHNILPYIQLPVITGRMERDLAITAAEARTLFHRLLELDRQEFGYDWLPTPPNVAWACSQRVSSCYLTSLGDVQLCNSTPGALGNIRRQALADILRSPFLQDLRRRDRVEGRCATCQHLWSTCYGGCTAFAAHAHGTPFASDTRCWH
jgi:radical SAM protein with 4Fe4S-binding SPASM domain